MHTKHIPLIGGMAIYQLFDRDLISDPSHIAHAAILIGSMVIIVIGLLDDKYELAPRVKLAGQLLAALIVIYYGNLQVEYVRLPFSGELLQMGMFSIPITFLWIIGVTNAINLIDGLDGLSAGVSGISLLAMAGMAYLTKDFYVMSLSILLFGAIIGFLPYNFHPAKIFMGDTGSLFLGYMISVLSLLGFKNITFISFIVPILILGVPISDTLFAIIRRIVKRRPISVPDKSHLHHCLLNFGFTHRQTVILIYSMSALFAMFAFIFSMTTVWGSIFFILIICFPSAND